MYSQKVMDHFMNPRNVGALDAADGVVANAPGTIDSDHTAELHLLLLNVTDKPVRLSPGQKVAQMVFSPLVQATFEAHD
jgi:dUTPase